MTKIKDFQIGSIPFYFSCLDSPHNPDGLPDVFDFSIREEDGVIKQTPNDRLRELLSIAYKKGSQILEMNDDGIGKYYADDFLKYICNIDLYIEKKEILEIGCGTGYLLSRLQFLGANVMGVEPGAHSAIGSGMYSLNIVNNFFENVKFDKKFDIVICYCVLEHIYNLDVFFNKIKEILNPDGIILLAVPNCKSYIDSGDVSIFIHEHWNYFTPQSLESTANNYGFAAKISQSTLLGTLYAILNRDENVQIRNNDINLAEMIDKIYRNKSILRDFFYNSNEKNISIGVYAPGRIINTMLMINMEDISNIRFFDDNKKLYGKYFPGIGISIENENDLVNTPVDVLLIASTTFGHAIRQRVQQSVKQIKIILLEDLLK